MTKDSKRRSVLKTLTWRIIASLTTIILVYTFSKSIVISASVGVVDFFAKIIAYYHHERIWLKNKKSERIKSVFKSITWRIIASGITTILVFIFSLDVGMSLTIGGLELIIKLLVYYIHEEIWMRVRWGRPIN